MLLYTVGGELRGLAAVFSARPMRQGKVAASIWTDRSVCLWELCYGRMLGRLIHPASVQSAAFDSIGLHLVSGCTDGAVRLWDLNAGRAMSLGSHEGSVLAVAASQDGRWVSSAGTDAVLRVWDRRTGREAMTLRVQTKPSRAAFCAGGRWAILGGDDAGRGGWVELWDLHRGYRLSRVDGLPGVVSNVALSYDRRSAAFSLGNGEIGALDLRRGERPRMLLGSGQPPRAMACSAEGNYLAGAGGSGLWLQTMHAASNLAWLAPTRDVRALGFSADARWLLSGGADGSVYLRNLPAAAMGTAVPGLGGPP